ncbi:MAG TPA: glutamate 5-kinase [Thermoanaerobaculia bacterium]|nr:glutamate 5-kinase [Thermoanaerobaculia bacterium]
MSPRAPHLEKVRRVVVKIGSRVLAPRGELDGDTIAALCAQLVAVRRRGLDVVLVTSGAVAAGRGQLGWKDRPRTIPAKQAAAAAGQPALLRAYASHLAPEGQSIAQILLTAEDVVDRRRFINARNTVSTLLSVGVLPIVNENDTVAVEEIKLGDNDRLSALVTNLIEAQLLVLLTDVDGFYTADPRREPDAVRHEFLPELGATHLASAGPTMSEVGLGGMVTKLEAARQAALSGASTVIACGTAPRVLERILDGEPVGTWIAAGRAIGARRHWIAYSSAPAGAVVVDDGARRALVDGGKSLLPSGIVEVRGEFGRGESVRILALDGTELGRGLVSYSGTDLRRIAGRRSAEIESILGYKYYDEAVRRDDFVLDRSRSLVGSAPA